MLDALIKEKQYLEADVGDIGESQAFLEREKITKEKTTKEDWIEQKKRRIVEESRFTWEDAIFAGGNEPRIPTSHEVRENIKDMAKKLQEIEDKLNSDENKLDSDKKIEIKISSWYRTPSINRRIGGAARSTHITGGGVDIRVEGYTSQQLAEKLED